MGRPSKSGLPAYLKYEKYRNIYRLILVNGKSRSLGSDKYKAIALANAYNNKMRGELNINMLIDESRTGPKPGGVVLPFNDILQDILDREKLGDAKTRELKNDMNRAKEYFTMPICDVDVEICYNYLQKYHLNLKGEPYNKKITFLTRLFKYAKARGLMKGLENPAESLIRQKKSAAGPKKRKRLSMEGFKAAYAIAPLHMKIAMDLALQLNQGREEIRNIKYRIKENDYTHNGCVWFDTPTKDGIYGELRIHRKKVLDHEAAHIAVPIGEKIKSIIERSKDDVLCPYVVHSYQRASRTKMSKEKTHIHQLKAKDVSDQFTDLINKCGLYDHLPNDERPTFHEIRALGAFLIHEMGVNPQARLAHTDAESTKIYLAGHIEMVKVAHVEIAI